MSKLSTVNVNCQRVRSVRVGFRARGKEFLIPHCKFNYNLFVYPIPYIFLAPPLQMIFKSFTILPAAFPLSVVPHYKSAGPISAVPHLHSLQYLYKYLLSDLLNASCGRTSDSASLVQATAGRGGPSTWLHPLGVCKGDGCCSLGCVFVASGLFAGVDCGQLPPPFFLTTACYSYSVRSAG